MIKDYEPLPEGLDPRVIALIRRLRGQSELLKLHIKHNERWVDWLLGAPLLPAETPANDNPRRKKANRAPAKDFTSLIAQLDAQWADFPGEARNEG